MRKKSSSSRLAWSSSGLAVCATLALAACTSAPQTETDAAAPLRVVAPVEPHTLNPVRSESRYLAISEEIYDELVGTGADGNPDESGLATSWTRIDDTTWEFELREGVKFHDGSDLTAEDVVFTIDQNQDDPQSRSAAFLERWVSAEATDDYTLVLKTVAPDNSVPALASRVRVLPSDYYKSVGPDGFDVAPIGSGPFEFKERRPGQSITLERNDNYWGETAKVDAVRFSWASDPTTRVAMLQSGEVEIVYDLPIQAVEQLADSGSATVATELQPSILTLSLRSFVDPLTDPELRKAVSLAIDRDTLVETVYGSMARPATSVFTTTLPGADQVELSYDPEEAKRLVAAHGQAPKITLAYTAGTIPQDKVVGQAVADMLERVGFSVSQEVVEHAKMIEAAAGGIPDGMHIWLNTFAASFPHPDTTLSYMVLGGIPGCVDTESYVEMATAARATTDTTEAKDQYEAIDDRAMAQDHCFVPLAQMTNIFGVSSNVAGFVAPAHGSPDFTVIDLE